MEAACTRALGNTLGAGVAHPHHRLLWSGRAADAAGGCRPVVRARRERERGPGGPGPITSTSSKMVVPTQLLRSDYAEATVLGFRCAVDTCGNGPPLLARVQEKLEGTPPLTVYSVRLSTGHGRGAALSEPNGAINLCLVGKDGTSILRRISPVHDPMEALDDVVHMCEIIDDGVGADCGTARALHAARPGQSPSNPSPSSTDGSGSSSSSNSSSSEGSGYVLPPRPPPPPRARFQEGCVDEVCFLAPELGPLAGILLGTESGSWVCDEVHVSSSRTHHMDRFVCRRLLGAERGEGAAFLTPVPAGAVVYGTGDASVVLSQEQATALREMSLDQYESLKGRLLSTTAVFAISGTGVAGLAGGADAALPFALGGIAGMAYQWLLQQGVDSLVVTAATEASKSPRAPINPNDDPAGAFGEAPSPQGRSTASIAGKLLSSPAARLAFVGVVAAAAIGMLQGPGGAGAANAAGSPLGLALGREQLWQFVVAVLGFMTYKLALVSVAITAEPLPVEVVNVESNRKDS